MEIASNFPQHVRCCRRHKCAGGGSDHALFGQRLNLLGRHPQQLTIYVVVVLAIAERSPVEAAPDVSRTLTHLDGHLGHGPAADPRARSLRQPVERRQLRIIRQIPQALRAAGHVVPPPPALRPAGSIVERAHDLKAYLNDLQHPAVFGQRVHLIAHSMGGLDARYMITKLDMAPRIVSLTTIGTPHHGSPIADLVSAGTQPLLRRFVEHLGVDVRGLADLTTAACQRFNTEVLDMPTVHYFSIAGHFTPALVTTTGWWRCSQRPSANAVSAGRS